MSALIEFENVEVFYGDFQALKGVSCSIGTGTIGLLGPNGAGKSTMMKTILGFNQASSGKVTMFGRPMPQSALEIRARLGYMPEREVVSPKISAVSFLTYCGRIFGMSRVDSMERTHEVLNYVGIGESRYRKMESYSTGMLQRVKLAQAIIHDPELLLLDEPTNGLDPDGRLEMLDLVKDIASKRKVTIILSSHLMPDVQHVCERIIMVSGGKIAREGTIKELTAREERKYEIRVRDNAAHFMQLALDAGMTCEEDDETGSLIIGLPSDMGDDARPIFELARGSGNQVRHFRPARHSLTEVFMQAVGGH